MAKNTSSKSKVKPRTSTTPADTKVKLSPPSPWSTPPPALRPFLESLNPKHVYITHIDQHPKGHKKRVFAMTAALNVAIATLLVWRATVALPWYISILFAMWGHEIETGASAPQIGSNTFINETVSRTGNFFFDFMLARFLVPWPLDFLVGYSSPTAWRLEVGFRDKEVGVRKSRKWDEQLAKGWIAEDANAAICKERIMPAIERQWIRAKTSYLMMDKSWDLDFAAMIRAHNLLKTGSNRLQDFEKTVIVYSEDFGWLVWEVWKLDEGAQDEGRPKILTFKEKLTEMGKEDLFYRWVEIVQFETSQPGGFTKERQAKAMQEARELFEKQGVDFDKFWEKVGGSDGSVENGGA
ncbi:MAG: hypothetical protein LQ340_005179 [Diploschistes diacapsis]|nr:MAG: hypothetical protein LQ340_005179 [Diploschistes diacapsis]